MLLTKYHDKQIRFSNGDSLIVDEVDSMLIDNADHLLYISHQIEDLTCLDSIFILIWQAVIAQGGNSAFRTESQVKIIQELILEKIKSEDIKIPKTINSFIEDNLKEWIENAYYATTLQAGNQYIMKDGNVVIMDLYTGVQQKNTQWSNGLHQFIQLKEKAKLTRESLRAIFMSNLTFFKSYGKNLNGMTGTIGAEPERDLLCKMYETDFFNLPRAQEFLFYTYDGQVSASIDDWLNNINNDVLTIYNAGIEFTSGDKEIAQAKINRINDVLTRTKKSLNKTNNLYKIFLSLKNNLETQIVAIRATFQDEKQDDNTLLKLSAQAMEITQKIEEIDTKLASYMKMRTILSKDIAELLSLNEYYKSVMDGDNRRASLIICENQNAAKMVEDTIRQSFQESKLPCNIYTYFRDADKGEEEFNLFEVKPGDIIIATNIAGRGTDLKINSTLKRNGGLHVILSYMPSNTRVEWQALGRAGRNGDPGTGRFIVCDYRKDLSLPISIEFLRDERDEAENVRLNTIDTIRIPKIQLEQDLFTKFATLEDNIKNSLTKKIEQLKILLNPNEDRRSQLSYIIELQIKSLRDKWGYWLAKEEQYIQSAYKTGRDRVFKSYDKFEKKIQDLIDNSKYLLITDAGELLKLAKFYTLNEAYSTAIECYDEVLKVASDGDFAAFAYYYKALCTLGKSSDHENKTQATMYLKKSQKILQESMSRLSSECQVNHPAFVSPLVSMAIGSLPYLLAMYKNREVTMWAKMHATDKANMAKNIALKSQKHITESITKARETKQAFTIMYKLNTTAPAVDKMRKFNFGRNIQWGTKPTL